MQAFTYNEAYMLPDKSKKRPKFKTIDCVLLPDEKNLRNKRLNIIADSFRGTYIEDEWRCNKSFGAFLKKGKYYSFLDVVFGLLQYCNERLKCGINEWSHIATINRIMRIWLKGGVITKADAMDSINQMIREIEKND